MFVPITGQLAQKVETYPRTSIHQHLKIRYRLTVTRRKIRCLRSRSKRRQPITLVDKGSNPSSSKLAHKEILSSMVTVHTLTIMRSHRFHHGQGHSAITDVPSDGLSWSYWV